MNKKITSVIGMALFLMFGAISYGTTNYAATDSSGSCFSNFYYNAQNGTVYFTDTSVVSNPVTGRTWDFGDGTYSTLKNPVHTYASGIYKANVCLHLKTATDSCAQCKQIIVRTADTCVANFSYSQIPGSSGYSYNFYDQSYATSPVNSRLWTLPGGITKTDTSFTFTFDTTLIQANVCLAIKTTSGCQASVCKTIVLKDTAVKKCTANFYAFSQNGTVSFQDSSKADTYIASWLWNFGDGTSSNLRNPVHTYSSNVFNAYVCLTIRSGTGCTASFCKLISVRDSASANCIADFSYSVQNRTVAFRDSSRADTVLYQIWNFGDGSYGSGSNPSHTYAGSNQYYNVCLTVRTKTDSCTTCKYVYIPSAADTCQANFAYALVADSSTTITYRFVDQSQNYGNIAWRRWALSDSTQSTDSVFVHTFDKNLVSASVCLTIGTNSGCQATTCKTIILKDTVP
ncbi:MAG TPA: PKD domain-containing protein, partial [Bacteroidales bacterium]